MATSTNHPSHPLSAMRLEYTIRRTAFDTSGYPGSLYDGQRDQLSNCSRIILPTQWLPCKDPIVCDVQRLEMAGTSNLFKYSSISEELQLSLALQMAPATGIGALINYTRPIDRYTYRLSCNWCSQIECLPDDKFQSLLDTRPPISDARVTHIVISVRWGVDCSVFLQLPPDDQLTEKILTAIQKLCTSVRDQQISSVMTPDEMSMLETIVHIETFSNIPDLSQINSMNDFHHKICHMKENKNLHKPYYYFLYPIEHLAASNITPANIFKKLQQNSIRNFQNYLFPLIADYKRLAATLKQDYPNLQQYLKEYLYKIRANWSMLKATYTAQIQSLQNLTIAMRSAVANEEKLDTVLKSEQMQDLRRAIKNLSDRAAIMQKKEHLIKNLIEKRFQYRDASYYNIKQNDDETTLEKKLLENHVKPVRHVCFDDTLYEKEKSRWDTIRGRLLIERNEIPQLQIIYVDFSDCDYRLKTILVLPRMEEKNNKDRIKSAARVRQHNSINILLLGESGAGKSTFINAFANYLTYKKLQHAERKPTVLIPVSFIITVGDDFKERQVKFGGMDTLSNEVHDSSTQSVTQHCKSYVFTLKENDDRRQRLRIIDTPGIGDVRGTAQDDINMQHILSYMNNLTHLDAICILMKPNNARLNVFFRSCLIQLFDLLGDNARDRIIFCFTNARSTFYAPGNTAPLLKEFLTTLPVRNIPFQKTNTFCFDSESFRYLIAKLNGITFQSKIEQDYEESWERSSTESKRFLEYIRNDLPDSHVFGERESIKDAQLKINLLIRPILETIRNTLRNIIYHHATLPQKSIKLCPRAVKCTTALCLDCPREIVAYDEFWITRDELHVFHNKCRTCKCGPDSHYPIDYQLEYEPYLQTTNVSLQELRATRSILHQASAEFAHFLGKATNTSQNDLFLIGFERMIQEEKNICKKKSLCERNKWLLMDLKEQKKTYAEQRQAMLDRNEEIQLTQIYNRIRLISEYPEIKLQMTAVQEWRKFMIKYYEYEVST